jgi:hypothetical protein
MYCPQCGAQLAEQAERCHGCDLDVRPVARMLQAGAKRDSGNRAYPAASGNEQDWTQQRQSWGKLLIMCSLLVGCLIPIVLGFIGFPSPGSIILVLAGLIGMLLMLGSIMLMAADREILVGRRSPTVPTSGAVRALADGRPVAPAGRDEPAPQRAPR